MSFIDNSGGAATSKDDIIRSIREEVTQQNITGLINVGTFWPFRSAIR